MKKAFKAVGIVVGIAALVALLGIAYFFWKYPDVDAAPTLTVSATPERLARGAYLAHHVTVCIDCHSDRDWSMFSGPPVPGTEGRGGFRFAEEMGLPGEIFAKNITPAGIGTMTDGELFHAIVSGIGKDGQVLFPLMPYPSYNKLTEEDLYSLIAYIRSLKPIENAVPETQINFPVKYLIRQDPSRYVPVAAPDTSDLYDYGRYLTTAAACADCHTPMEKGEFVPGMGFAGGHEFVFPEGVIRSANISPDEETGIGAWSEEIFIAKFKQYDNADPEWLKQMADPHNSPMPWSMYAGMKEKDLKAIYKFLRTVPPVSNKVETFTAAAR